ncbi:hypothetical protein AB0D08_00460 [Kitasatospora sp. NPDC048540]|uniref:hypothetical protein n=1 Tax=Kitasatospora sp. NPDC048540 TaxID=3155634 RepID=UPI0033F45597
MDEERIAATALEDASDLAAHYGRDWPTAASAPRLVRTLVLKAATRYLRNPDGYIQSRAGDETLAWSDAAGTDAGTVYFTAEEVRLLEGLGGRKPGLGSATVSAWGSKIRDQHRSGDGWVPVEYIGGKPFPLFNDPESPW